MIAASRKLLLTLPLTVPATVASWLAMMVVHESGHVLAAWATGGTIQQVVLHPLEFSRTDLTSNPQPLVVAFAGGVWGSIAPMAVWGISRAVRARTEFLLRYFSGFCLVANGAYFGTALLATGLVLWHGLGSAFAANSADRRLLIIAWSVLSGIVGGMLLWSAR